DEVRAQLRLGDELLAVERILRRLLLEHLDGDALLEARIAELARLVDGAHAAGRDRPLDLPPGQMLDRVQGHARAPPRLVPAGCPAPQWYSPGATRCRRGDTGAAAAAARGALTGARRACSLAFAARRGAPRI